MHFHKRGVAWPDHAGLCARLMFKLSANWSILKRWRSAVSKGFVPLPPKQLRTGAVFFDVCDGISMRQPAVS